MAAGRFRFLDRADEELVHTQSLKSLETIGVLIRSPSVLKMLGDAGANIDVKNNVAKIPEGMVIDALKKAPKSFRLHARDPKKDLQLPSELYPYISTTGLAIYVRDLETGQNRPSTRKDIADIVRLGDAIDIVDYLWTTLTATDVPEMAHGLHELWIAFQNTTKHVQGVSVTNAEECRNQIKLAALIAGGEEELRRRPIFSVICCPIAPLSFERGAVEGQVELAKAGIPVVSMSMSLGGMSAPVTLAGTIVNANTENLASIVITQTASPGSPHIYSSESTPVNMMTGNINYECIEAPLISAGTTQMAKRYGLPCLTGGWGLGADDNVPGILSSLTEVTGLMMGVFSGSDLSAGAASIDVAKGASLEQLVIDAYVWENVRPFMRKFSFSEETAALDVVKEVGHGNSFLTHPHTAKNFRKELYFRNKETLAWEATLSDKMVPEAAKVAKRLLRDHEVPELSTDALKRGNDIIRNYEKAVAT